MLKSIFSIFNWIFNTRIRIRNRVRILILTADPGRANWINVDPQPRFTKSPDADQLRTHKICNCLITQGQIRKRNDLEFRIRSLNKTLRIRNTGSFTHSWQFFSRSGVSFFSAEIFSLYSQF